MATGNTISSSHPAGSQPRSFGHVPPDIAVEFYSYTNERYIPPLRIVATGMARLTNGNFWTRTRSTLLSVELVTAGNVIFEQSGTRQLVGPNQVFIVQPGRDSTVRVGPAGFVEKRYVIIEGPLVDPTLRLLGLHETNHIIIRSPGRIGALMKQVHRILGNKNEGFTLQLSSLAYQLFLELSVSCAPTVFPAVIAQAIAFMQRTIDSTIDSADLAHQACMTVSNFNRIFRKHTGMPPIKYFLDLKMRHAAQALCSTAISIKQVSQDLGYDNPFYFSRLFKKVLGVSPRDYRESNV